MSKINSKALQAIRNAFILPKQGNRPNDYSNGTNPLFNVKAGGSEDPNKNMNARQIPISPSRVRQDPQGWREAIMESERAILPYRVKMQEIFRDTLDGDAHVTACVNKRRNLTLLRQFALVDENGVPDEEWTKYINKKWFKDFMAYTIDAKLFGYSLISLGDIISNELKDLTIIRRDNISPERKQVCSYPYDPAGPSWEDPNTAPWHIWVSTPNEHGTTSCGYGLFYPISLLSILARNSIGFNADYMEMFAAPYRALFMEDISNEVERGRAEQALSQQGSMGSGIFGKNDKLEVLNSSGGNGFKSYADFEMRIEKKQSKVLLGHSDAIDSTPGKLGAGSGGGKNGGDHSPAVQAMLEIQQADGEFIEPIVNEQLLTRLRYHGIMIPENLTFAFLNSEEDNTIIAQKNEQNKVVTASVKDLIGSNLSVDPVWFFDQTGIKVNEITPQVNTF